MGGGVPQAIEVCLFIGHKVCYFLVHKSVLPQKNVEAATTNGCDRLWLGAIVPVTCYLPVAGLAV